MSASQFVSPQVTQHYGYAPLYWNDFDRFNSCAGNDPLTGNEDDDHGTDIVQCSSINPTLCPNLPGITPPTAVWAPVPGVRRRLPQNVSCQYPVNEFTNVEALATYLNTTDFNNSLENPNFKDPNLDVIMQNFCSAPTNDCPVNPITGKPMQACSNFVGTQTFPGTTTTTETFCSEWAKVNPTVAQTIRVQYCNSNPENEDCQCIKANLNPVFQQLSGILKSQEGVNPDAIPINCWWVPCQAQSDTTFLPCTNCSQPCTSTFCDVIINANAQSGSSININNVKTYTGCSGGGSNPNGGGSNPNTPSNGGNPNPNSGGSGSGKFIERYRQYIIAFVILFFVIIIFIFISRARSKRGTVVSS